MQKSIQQLNREDIARNLKPDSLRTTQIIQLAIVIGPVIFFGLCMLLHMMADAGRSSAGEPELEMLLLQVMGLMFVGILVALSLVPSQVLKPERLVSRAARGALSESDPVEWAVQIHRTIVIIRLALLEGIALFGLVILLLAVMGNRLNDHPIVWFSTGPLVIYMLYGLVTFPTKAAVVEFIDARIVAPLRRRSG